MNQELIEKARRGEIAVHNVDCTVEELHEVVGHIIEIPDGAVLNTGYNYFFMHNGEFSCGAMLFIQKRIKPVPVRDFLQDPTNDSAKGEIGTL